MLLPPSLTVIGEYVWETRTEMTLIDKDANLQQTYFPCILPTTSSFYQNILQLHGIMGQLIVRNNSFSKMFLSYMVFFHVHENNLPGFAQVASSQVHTFKKYRHIGSCT